MSTRAFGTAFPFLVLEIIEHVGDSAGESEHDNKERYQEHHHVLHHSIDAENDWPKVLGSNPYLDYLDDGECKCYSPENSPRGTEAGYFTVAATDDVIHNLYYQSNHKEKVHHYVVVIPKCEISLFESFLIRTRTLQSPEKESSTEVSHCVGNDKDQQQSLNNVDDWISWFCHVTDNERDEDDIREGSVDASI